jgi:hypothetical protein
MKMRGFRLALACAALMGLAGGSAAALETRSGEFMAFMLGYIEPSGPRIFEDAVVFSAPSLYKRVGVAFAHENFEKIHWFVKLLVPIDDTVEFDPKSKIPPEMLRDSGVLFYAYAPEKALERLEYRLIIDGLWCADPLNPRKRADPVTGIDLSVAPVPPHDENAAPADRKALSLRFRAPPGEIITAAGDFNGWDPFMYQLRETRPGLYTLTIPLPSGKWRYVFFHRGQRVLDPANLDREYASNGMVANVVTIQ